VAKLDATGSTLMYATYLGGSGDDGIGGLAVGPDGSAYVTGSTESSDFPVTVFLSNRGPVSAGELVDYVFGDAFFARLKPDGSGLMVSEFIGGTADDGGSAIALDPAGNVILAGSTASPDFPVTPDALQPKFGGFGPGFDPWPPKGDGFLMMLSPAGKTLYSTFLGGALGDWISALAVDNAGNAYVSGFTLSANYPVTSGAFQKTHALTSDNKHPTPTSEEQADAFITKISGLMGASSDLAYCHPRRLIRPPVCFPTTGPRLNFCSTTSLRLLSMCPLRSRRQSFRMRWQGTQPRNWWRSTMASNRRPSP
jgi:Beta-propeller repeat